MVFAQDHFPNLPCSPAGGLREQRPSDRGATTNPAVVAASDLGVTARTLPHKVHPHKCIGGARCAPYIILVALCALAFSTLWKRGRRANSVAILICFFTALMNSNLFLPGSFNKTTRAPL